MATAPTMTDQTSQSTRATLSDVWERFVARFEAWSESRPIADAGRAFRELSALSDEQLAERGLSRDELAWHCYGRHLYC